MWPISAPAGPAALALENFLAVLTIIFLRQHLRLKLPRSRTEKLAALRAADAKSSGPRSDPNRRVWFPQITELSMTDDEKIALKAACMQHATALKSAEHPRVPN
jgi:hypothetical protein